MIELMGSNNSQLVGPLLAQAAEPSHLSVSWLDLLLHNWLALVIIMCVLAGVASSLIKECRKYVSHRHELEFKRDLVERGLSVEEIERVVAAKGTAVSKDKA